ncbi:Reticulon family protein putative isoform 1 [Tripterygium wilfordii]|uniref:Reticulon-like protein n=1 Tax=Tripterygium wilfordii TaxID=458696 RepID=A0A7J7D6S7_TRIWF|nr:reticulon-like protein B21 [Tripterygium wilfordii]KAF5742075.1 Reticulon family protein putative isoform 1 [Tripterygium wilfordii]
MDVSRRRGGDRSSVVAAGSVWESRMKLDEVKGGIKVFNGGGEDSNQEEGVSDSPASKRVVKRGQTQNSVGGVAVSGKRKTWKSEGNPIQIAKSRSDSDKNFEEQCNEISVSVNGVKRSPIQTRKGKFEGSSRELSLSTDGIERSPIQVKKGRSEGIKEVGVVASVDGNERSPIQIRKPRSGSSEFCKDVESSLRVVERNSDQLRKAKSETNKVMNQSGKNLGDSEGEIGWNSVQTRRAESEPIEIVKQSGKRSSNGEPVDGIDKNPDEIEKNGSDDSCKEFDECQEKAILSNVSTVGMEKHDDDADDDDEHVGEEFEEEDEEVETEIEKNIDVKVINVPEKKPDKVVNEETTPNKVVKEVPTPPIVTKQPPTVRRRATIYQNLQNPSKPASVPVSDGYQSHPQTQSKLQSLVDLVMWRDISRSAFIFGIGTFIIVSSSYTKDLNISFISVVSYLGLVYLAAIFLYRSIIRRGIIDIDDASYVLGEEEAVWLLRLILPYINEFLLKLKALFSGEPATTMKLAVLLFVLGRCGNSITIWKMAKLGFFGVFTVPKVCSSYSTQLTLYAKFWVRRFGDAWESCAHKKAVAFAFFTLVWNLSSIVARIWAVFMLFVAVRYYQHSLVRDEWAEDEAAGEEAWDGQIGGQGQRRGPTLVDVIKAKKGT